MRLRSEIETLVGAIHFFTRLTVPGRWSHDAVSLERAIRYFPITGAIVGAGAALAFCLTSLVWPKSLAILAAVAIAIYLTGAIHEDGWSDMVDGFGSAADKDRILAIMRSSQLGSHGAVALIVLLLVRFAALIEIDSALVAIALIAGHAFSRLCATFILSTLDYARSDGKAKPFGNRLSGLELAFASFCALIPVLLLPWEKATTALALAAIATMWLRFLFKRRIGGYTGDCIGATQQLTETVFYLGLLANIA